VKEEETSCEGSNYVKCQRCKEMVAPARKRTHAADRHMMATLKCPMEGCDFETTGSLFNAVSRFNGHRKVHEEENPDLRSNCKRMVQKVKQELCKKLEECFPRQVGASTGSKPIDVS